MLKNNTRWEFKPSFNLQILRYVALSGCLDVRYGKGVEDLYLTMSIGLTRISK